MNVREHWGSEIKKHRQSWFLTQDDLARLLGVSQASVTAWERGTRTPDPETLVRLVRVLEIDPRALFTIEVDERDVA